MGPATTKLLVQEKEKLKMLHFRLLYLVDLQTMRMIHAKCLRPIIGPPISSKIFSSLETALKPSQKFKTLVSFQKYSQIIGDLSDKLIFIIILNSEHAAERHRPETIFTKGLIVKAAEDDDFYSHQKAQIREGDHFLRFFIVSAHGLLCPIVILCNMKKEL